MYFYVLSPLTGNRQVVLKTQVYPQDFQSGDAYKTAEDIEAVRAHENTPIILFGAYVHPPWVPVCPTELLRNTLAISDAIQRHTQGELHQEQGEQIENNDQA